MEQVIFAKGDIVCRKKKFGKEYLRVISARGSSLLCAYLGHTITDMLLISKREAYKYNVGHIFVHKDVLKRLVLGNQNVVYGPLTQSWKSICVSMIHPVPDVIKINNGWKGWAIFQYIEAARVYVAQEVQVRLEVGRLLEQFDI